jgi:hypothetical protein
MKRTKSELEISFDSFYKLNKLRYYSYSIFISSLITLILDFGIDFNIYFYFLNLIVFFLILIKALKRALIHSFVKHAHFINNDSYSYHFGKIRIRYKDKLLDYKNSECGFALIDGFLFVTIPRFIENNGLVTKIFIITSDLSNLQQMYTELMDGRKVKLKWIFSYFFISVAILISVWKIDLYVLNKFVLSEEKIWIVKLIQKNNKDFIKVDTCGVSYLGLKNNFTNDTSKLFSNVYFFNFRYEPFQHINLLYGSGISDNKIMDDLIKDKRILDSYRFVLKNDTMILYNDKYKLICVKK